MFKNINISHSRYSRQLIELSLSKPKNILRAQIVEIISIFTAENTRKSEKQTNMKKVEAIIRKAKFEEVKKALHEADIDFFTYWDVTGVGKEKEGHIFRGAVYDANRIQRRML